VQDFFNSETLYLEVLLEQSKPIEQLLTPRLFTVVLLTRHQYEVIKAAILGSILATQLLCLGLCFFAGGMRRDEQEFDEVVSEVGSGLLLTA
jgi:calcium/proton exchanger cax